MLADGFNYGLVLALLVMASGAAFVLISVLSYLLNIDQADRKLYRWAERNGLQLVSHGSRTFHRGPYFLRSTNVQVVYRITAKDGTGRTRSGYVRLGGWWLGLASDAADATWD